MGRRRRPTAATDGGGDGDDAAAAASGDDAAAAGCGDDVPPLCDDRAVSSSTLIWRWLKTSDGGITVSVSRCSWSFLRDSSCAAERLRNHSLVNAIGRFDMVRCALAV